MSRPLKPNVFSNDISLPGPSSWPVFLPSILERSWRHGVDVLLNLLCHVTLRNSHLPLLGVCDSLDFLATFWERVPLVKDTSKGSSKEVLDLSFFSAYFYPFRRQIFQFSRL